MPNRESAPIALLGQESSGNYVFYQTSKNKNKLSHSKVNRCGIFICSLISMVAGIWSRFLNRLVYQSFCFFTNLLFLYSLFLSLFFSLEFKKNTFPAWRKCTADMGCSGETVQGYMARYAVFSRLEHQPTCEDFARIHNGGPNGYNRTSTLKYWSKVNECLNGRKWDFN